VGARFDPAAARGRISPVEGRVLLGIPYGDLGAEEAAYLGGRSPLSDLAVVLRTGFAYAVAPRRSAIPEPQPWIVSARVANLSIEEALEAIFAPPVTGRPRIVHFVHPHALNLAARDPLLAGQLERADLVLPDGVGIRLAALILGIAMRDNVNGTDLWPAIFRTAAARGLPVALVGAAPGLAQASAEQLARSHPSLRVPIVSHGYLKGPESHELAARIRSVGRCLVFVGMGTPRQEAWAWSHLADAPDVTVVTVGGLFDFLSGRVQRAPVAWRELGLEWLFRAVREPRRYAWRYLTGNPLFLLRALRQRFLSGYRPHLDQPRPAAPDTKAGGA
jgi:N-acetylglucosaminyldiphosphoundecaprenol N-acetyl-beta-D-mannosaminyltransferase